MNWWNGKNRSDTLRFRVNILYKKAIKHGTKAVRQLLSKSSFYILISIKI